MRRIAAAAGGEPGGARDAPAVLPMSPPTPQRGGPLIGAVDGARDVARPSPSDGVVSRGKGDSEDGAESSAGPRGSSAASTTPSTSSCGSFFSFASDESLSRTEDPLLAALAPPSPRAALIAPLPHPKDPPDAITFRAAKTLLTTADLSNLPEAVGVGILALRTILLLTPARGEQLSTATPAQSPAVRSLSSLAAARLRSAAKKDPEGALAAARETLESAGKALGLDRGAGDGRAAALGPAGADVRAALPELAAAHLACRVAQKRNRSKAAHRTVAGDAYKGTSRLWSAGGGARDASRSGGFARGGSGAGGAAAGAVRAGSFGVRGQSPAGAQARSLGPDRSPSRRPLRASASPGSHATLMRAAGASPVAAADPAAAPAGGAKPRHGRRQAAKRPSRGRRDARGRSDGGSWSSNDSDADEAFELLVDKARSSADAAEAAARRALASGASMGGGAAAASGAVETVESQTKAEASTASEAVALIRALEAEMVAGLAAAQRMDRGGRSDAGVRARAAVDAMLASTARHSRAVVAAWARGIESTWRAALSAAPGGAPGRAALAALEAAANEALEAAAVVGDGAVGARGGAGGGGAPQGADLWASAALAEGVRGTGGAPPHGPAVAGSGAGTPALVASQSYAGQPGAPATRASGSDPPTEAAWVREMADLARRVNESARRVRKRAEAVARLEAFLERISPPRGASMAFAEALGQLEAEAGRLTDGSLRWGSAGLGLWAARVEPLVEAGVDGAEAASLACTRGEDSLRAVRASPWTWGRAAGREADATDGAKGASLATSARGGAGGGDGGTLARNAREQGARRAPALGESDWRLRHPSIAIEEPRVRPSGAGSASETTAVSCAGLAGRVARPRVDATTPAQWLLGVLAETASTSLTLRRLSAAIGDAAADAASAAEAACVVEPDPESRARVALGHFAWWERRLLLSLARWAATRTVELVVALTEDRDGENDDDCEDEGSGREERDDREGEVAWATANGAAVGSGRSGPFRSDAEARVGKPAGQRALGGAAAAASAAPDPALPSAILPPPTFRLQARLCVEVCPPLASRRGDEDAKSPEAAAGNEGERSGQGRSGKAAILATAGGATKSPTAVLPPTLGAQDRAPISFALGKVSNGLGRAPGLSAVPIDGSPSLTIHLEPSIPVLCAALNKAREAPLEAVGSVPRWRPGSALPAGLTTFREDVSRAPGVDAAQRAAKDAVRSVRERLGVFQETVFREVRPVLLAALRGERASREATPQALWEAVCALRAAPDRVVLGAVQIECGEAKEALVAELVAQLEKARPGDG